MIVDPPSTIQRINFPLVSVAVLLCSSSKRMLKAFSSKSAKVLFNAQTDCFCCFPDRLPYRYVFAVATQDAILFYDTQQSFPFGHVSQIHYLRLTDLSWSPDGRFLIATSTDGFSTFVTFDVNELGPPYRGKLLELEELEPAAAASSTSANNTGSNAAGDGIKGSTKKQAKTKEAKEVEKLKKEKVSTKSPKNTSSPTITSKNIKEFFKVTPNPASLSSP